MADNQFCACGRHGGDGFWVPGMVLTRYDGTHAVHQCEIDQLVTADRPEQDVLLRRIAAVRDVLDNNSTDIAVERDLAVRRALGGKP